MDTNKMINWLKSLSSMLFLTMLSSSSFAVMTALDDESLSNQTGQALFFTEYVAPGATGSPAVNNGIGFFTLGMSARVELNANISRLQLGCGGVNGPGVCDIDIDDVSLAGLNPVNGSFAGTNTVFENPFLMLAIKNPTSLSTREVVGVKFGALSALGSMLIGQNNGPGQTPTDYNNSGINRLSGTMGFFLEGAKMNACIKAIIGSGCGLLPAFPAVARPHSQLATLNRAYQLDDLGPLIADSSLGPVPLVYTNLHLVNTPLVALHEVKLANRDNTPSRNVSLSVQKQPVAYPFIDDSGAQSFKYTDILGTANATVPTANTGWWMNIPSATIETVTSTQTVILTAAQAATGIFGLRVDVQPVDFGQNPVPNCYGGLKFC
jgi:hypothetical protein